VEGVGERFLADHVLARFERRQHDLAVCVARRDHVHQSDVLARYEASVVRLVGLPA